MAEPLIHITYRRAIIFACFLVMYEFLTYIANDMIMPGMIQVVHGFNASESYVATSLTWYMLGGASLQVLLGPISDAYGRRPVMLFGASLFLVFTLLIACSHTMNQFLVARFFQGMGLCFIAVIGYATIQEIFAETDAIKLIAIMANAAILAPLLGPLAGAVVIHYTSWRVIFISIAAFAVLTLWGLWRYMPEPVGAMKRDGTVIEKGHFSAASILNNYKALIINPRFCCCAIAIGLLAIPCMVWIALAPVMLIAEAKLSVVEYALWQIPVFGATIVGNIILHQLTDRFKIKTIIFLGTGVFLLGAIFLALIPYLYAPGYKTMLPGFMLYFLILGLITAPLNRFCLYITPVTKGTTSALISLAVMVIAALGIEGANLAYSNKSYLHLGIYCLIVALIYLVLIILTFAQVKEDVPIDL